MTNGDHKQHGFEPLHDAHAIEQVVFAIQFQNTIDDAVFKEICDDLDLVTGDLPKKVPLDSPNLMGPNLLGQNFTFTIGSAPSPIPSVHFGMIHQIVQPDGTVGIEFRVDRISIVFRTTRYTRWAETWSRARKYYDVVLPKYVAKSRVAGISLNYVDKFVWNGAPADCRPSLLLAANSKYLCPHVYESPDLWHSHTGAFTRIDKQTKRLLNVNVDYLDEQRGAAPRRTIVIGTVLSDLMNQPEFEPLDISETDAISFFDLRMQQLHDYGKTVFANIINDPMSKRIALKAQN
jgi:uncharacterized protein (TIGR04255 family)